MIKAALAYFVQVINFLIFARIVISWVARGKRNQIIDLIYQLTEPILAPFRELQNKLGIGGMLDFSPIMAILTMELMLSLIMRL